MKRKEADYFFAKMVEMTENASGDISEYKGEYCESCYYRQNADAAIKYTKIYGENEGNKIEPCNHCEYGSLYVFDDDYYELKNE